MSQSIWNSCWLCRNDELWQDSIVRAQNNSHNLAFLIATFYEQIMKWDADASYAMMGKIVTNYLKNLRK